MPLFTRVLLFCSDTGKENGKDLGGRQKQGSLFETAFQRGRVFKAFGRSFLLLDPLYFSLSSERNIEWKRNTDGHFASRRAASRVPRKGLEACVCRRGRFRRGAIICYRATARPKCSFQPRMLPRKAFSAATTTREREREREAKVSSIDRKIVRNVFLFPFSFTEISAYK